MASRSALGLTVTVDAAVRGAYAACGHHLLSQGFPGPVHADGGIVRRDAGPRGEVSQASFLQIDGLDGVAVLRLDVPEQGLDTLADLPFEQFIGFLMVPQMGDELPGNAFRRPTLAVIVGDGVAENAIELGDNALLVADGASFLQATHEGRLQNVFRGGLGLDPFFEEGQELLPSIHEPCDGFRGETGVRCGTAAHPGSLPC